MPKFNEQIQQDAERRGSVGGGAQVPTATQTYNNGITPPVAGAPPRRTSTNSLAAAFDGKLSYGAFVLTDVGLDVKEGIAPTQADWQAIGATLKLVSRAFKWILADYLVKGEELLWGEKYAEAAEWSGYEEKTLRDYASIARRVKLSIRIDKLSFGHHQVVAALPANEQSKWLNAALENKWSVKRLTKEIEGAPVSDPPARDPYGTKRYVRVSNQIRRFVESNVSAESIDLKDARKVLERVQENREYLAQVESWIQGKLSNTGGAAPV